MFETGVISLDVEITAANYIDVISLNNEKLAVQPEVLCNNVHVEFYRSSTCTCTRGNNTITNGRQ